jgi:amino-acid N-acetyltransferase
LTKQDLSIGAATAADLPGILKLLEMQGLPRSGLSDHIASALVARQSGTIVGSAALELYSGGVLLRSVAVDATLQGQGLGTRLTEAAIDVARASGAPAIYLLTTTAEGFFPRFGFVRIDRQNVPGDVQQSVEFVSACPASAIVMCKALV